MEGEYILLKARIGGPAMWRNISKYLKPGEYEGVYLPMSKKSGLYLLPTAMFEKMPDSEHILYLRVKDPDTLGWKGALQLKIRVKHVKRETWLYTSEYNEIELEIGGKKTVVKPPKKWGYYEEGEEE